MSLEGLKQGGDTISRHSEEDRSGYGMGNGCGGHGVSRAAAAAVQVRGCGGRAEGGRSHRDRRWSVDGSLQNLDGGEGGGRLRFLVSGWMVVPAKRCPEHTFSLRCPLGNQEQLLMRKLDIQVSSSEQRVEPSVYRCY